MLLFDSSLIQLNIVLVLFVGWILDDEQVMYEIDLIVWFWVFVLNVLEGGVELLEFFKMVVLLVEFGQVDWEMDLDWFVVVLLNENGEFVVLGVVGLSGCFGWVSINMFGVCELECGQGFGIWLYVYLFVCVVEWFMYYVGWMEVSNYVMWWIFECNVSEFRVQQLYFRSF